MKLRPINKWAFNFWSSKSEAEEASTDMNAFKVKAAVPKRKYKAKSSLREFFNPKEEEIKRDGGVMAPSPEVVGSDQKYPDTYTPCWKNIRAQLPPLNKRLLVCTDNKQWVGFLLLKQPWSQGIQVNLFGPEMMILATYTSEITHWIDFDELLEAMSHGEITNKAQVQ